MTSPIHKTTVEPAPRKHHLHRARPTPRIANFNERYSLLEKSSERSELMPDLYQIFDEFTAKRWKKEALAELARTYVLLQPRDRNALIKRLKTSEKETVKFPPLRQLADQCVLETTIRQAGALTFEECSMAERYRSTYNCLGADEKRQFNAFITKGIGKEKPSEKFTLPLHVERSGLKPRLGVYTLHLLPFSVAISSTHQYVMSQLTLDTDPIADDCAFFSDETVLFSSLTDGGGHGPNVANAAIKINALFMNCMHSLIQRHLSPMETLREAIFQTSKLYERETLQEAATHSGFIARLNLETGVVEACISLLGDTGACLLVEWDDGTVQIEKLLPLDFNKSVSSNGSCISSHSDFGNLRFCQFTVPAAKKVLVIQATDGLWDNLDPRNALKPEISDAVSTLMSHQKQFYQSATLPLNVGDISLNQVFLNAKDQKDSPIYEATHQFPTPQTLQMHLNNEASLKTCQSTWKDTPLDTLLPLYEKSIIEQLYRNSKPEEFARHLVEFAKRQGKPDDIGVLIVDPSFVVFK